MLRATCRAHDPREPEALSRARIDFALRAKRRAAILAVDPQSVLEWLPADGALDACTSSVSPAKTKILSGAVALLAGALTYSVILVAVVKRWSKERVLPSVTR